MSEHDYQEEHEHHHGPLDELVTLRDWLRYAVSRFNQAGLFFGHGCEDAYDEAAYLLLHSLHLPLNRLEPFLDACITSAEREQIFALIERRVNERIPAAYLTQEAWLGEFKFYVDERVIVPRSYCAELLENGLAPWVADSDEIGSAMDLCTGSGCLAILMAHVFPHAEITAVDLSADALEVATQNVADYQLAERITLCRSNVYQALPPQQRFDLILSNPPYVTQASMDTLPEEYRHEPEMALAGGEDGMDIVRDIIQGAAARLNPHGLLVVEVGHNRAEVEAAFPELDFTWLSTPSGEEKVFLLHRDQLTRLS